VSFKQYIAESLDSFGKLKHLEHVEDHILQDDARGYQHVKDLLHSVHDRILGKPSTTKITTKFDGSPSIVFGHDPKTGKFFVGTKAVLSDKPTLNFTEADIEKHYSDRPELAAKLKSAREHLVRVVPHTGVYQGDFMYNKDTIHEDDKAYHFTPNTLMYSIKKKDPEAEKIKHAQIGIVVHTKYHGKDLGSMTAGFEPDLHNFRGSRSVHLIDPNFHLDKSLGGEDFDNNFTKHITDAEKTYLKAHPETFKETVGHANFIKKYINDTVRNGEKPTAIGLKASITNYYKQEADKLKTVAGRLKKKEQLLSHLNHMDEHHEKYQSLFDLHHHLQQAKNVLIDALDKTNHYVTSVDGREGPGEGFVAIHHGFPSKLVNREGFSRINLSKHK